jgi:hypothetical protein
MAGRIITVGTLLALTQAKAIISNHCPKSVYVWSVPSVGSTHTENLPIPPGGQYEEPWHHGTSDHPGIALKVSTQANGIYKGMDEINFAYSIERSDKSKVWVDLSLVRGKPFDNNLAFHTCHGMHQSADVQPGKCEATDNIELVLCDTARSSTAKDTISPGQIAECYDNSDDDSDDEHPTTTSCTKSTKTDAPTTWTTSRKPHADTSLKHVTVTYHEISKYTTTMTNHVTVTVTEPTYVADESTMKHATVTSHAPPKNATVTYFLPPFTDRPGPPAPRPGSWKRNAKQCQAKITYPRPALRLAKDRKRCILPFCEPNKPGVKCADAAKSMEKQGLGTVDWTEDEDVCVA